MLAELLPARRVRNVNTIICVHLHTVQLKPNHVIAPIDDVWETCTHISVSNQNAICRMPWLEPGQIVTADNPLNSTRHTGALSIAVLYRIKDTINVFSLCYVLWVVIV